MLPVMFFLFAGCGEKGVVPGDVNDGGGITIKPGYELDPGDIETVSPLTPRKELSKMEISGSQITIYSSKVKQEVKVALVSDTHLVDCDGREDEYKKYSTRMYESYSNPQHGIVTKDTDIKQYFKNFINMAVEQKAKAMFSLGDLLSYPSEYAIEWVNETVSSVSIPFYPINGNHDWHYEMYPGTPDQIREKWTNERLKTIFPKGVDPMCYSVEIDGVLFVLIDDGTDEIKLKQLEFMRGEIATGKPIVLLMHVPLYAEPRSIGWSVAHPAWRYNTASSKNYFDKAYFTGEYERKNPMHTNVTKSFYNEVLSADNVMGCIAGHIHSLNEDNINGLPMVTIACNFKNNSYCLTVAPEKQ